MGFAVATLTLGSAVASPAGTVALAYPAGTVQADFTGANASATAYLLLNSNDRFKEADGKFDISYGASSVTITNKTGFAWPIGTKLTVNLANKSPVGAEALRPSGPVAALALVPLATSNTYTDAALNAQFTNVQNKLNDVLVALRASGILLTT